MSQMSDPREHLRAALDQSTRLVAAVAPDQLGLPTPCAEFDVRALVRHMTFAADRVGSAGRREAIPAEGEPLASPADDGQFADTFRRSAERTLAAWDGPGALDGEIALPFGTFPAAVVVSIYALEQVTHAWDLATATGQVARLDPSLAEVVLPVAHQMVPAEGRAEPLPFGPVVEVADDAPAYDRLAGYMGRRPAAADAGGR